PEKDQDSAGGLMRSPAPKAGPASVAAARPAASERRIGIIRIVSSTLGVRFGGRGDSEARARAALDLSQYRIRDGSRQRPRPLEDADQRQRHEEAEIEHGEDLRGDDVATLGRHRAEIA